MRMFWMALALALAWAHAAAAQNYIQIPKCNTASPPAGASSGYMDANGNVCVTVATDPCQSATKLSVPISQTANTKLFSQAAGKKNYICSIVTVGADAENLSLVEGTGSTCGTSTAAIIGGATAAAGPNFAANGGFALGNGAAFVAAGANANFDTCLFQSGSGRVAGVLTYVQN